MVVDGPAAGERVRGPTVPLSSENERSEQATVRSIVKIRDESVSPRRY